MLFENITILDEELAVQENMYVGVTDAVRGGRTARVSPRSSHQS